MSEENIIEEVKGISGRLGRFIYANKLVDLRRLGRIEYSSSIVIGSMRTGKTTMAMIMAKRLENLYGDDIAVWYSRSFADIIHSFDDNIDMVKRPYQFFIIDDVGRTLSWSASMARNLVDVHYYTGIAHVYEKYGVYSAHITIFILSQYLKLVAPVFRANSPLLMFKSVMLREKTEYREIRNVVSSEGVRILRDLTFRALINHDINAKKEMLAVWMDKFEQHYYIPDPPVRPRNLIDCYDIIDEDEIESVAEILVNRQFKLLPKRLRRKLVETAVFVLVNSGFNVVEIKRILRGLGFSFENEFVQNLYSLYKVNRVA
ncbi:MAG: hypothetical protein J7K23_04175 [Thermoproteales archaeon]|nr:hypothetical protein [Thermoproteales archaeon]